MPYYLKDQQSSRLAEVVTWTPNEPLPTHVNVVVQPAAFEETGSHPIMLKALAFHNVLIPMYASYDDVISLAVDRVFPPKANTGTATYAPATSDCAIINQGTLFEQFPFNIFKG